MYIEVTQKVLKDSIKVYAARGQDSAEGILTEIRRTLDETHAQYWEDIPQIDYHDSLCRLGYLHRHVPANATLFDKMLASDVEAEVFSAATLNVCALGGGPGTELLGLAKHILRQRDNGPRKVVFRVLDIVPQWAEIWEQLKEATVNFCESAVKNEPAYHNFTLPPMEANFLTFDVFDPRSYQDYAFQFSKTDLVVCNYLFSENKTKLEEARLAINHLMEATKPGCLFVVIDRLEQRTSFRSDIINLFKDACGNEINPRTFHGVLDWDEQENVIDEDILNALGRLRLKFDARGIPKVFGFTAVRK